MVRGQRDLASLSADELFRLGVAAARVGDAGEARKCLVEVTERDPEHADAWLWLAGLEANPVTKRDHFERVLDIRPGDDEARAGLARLAEKYGSGVLEDPGENDVLHCTWHPDRETLLRCNRCGKPMCTQCARQHPVGLRCKQCVSETRSPLYRVSGARYAAAAVVGLVASTVAALIVGALNFFWFIWLFLGAGIGTAIAEAVSVAAGRKRGRGLQLVAGGAMLAGVAVAGLAMSGSPLGLATNLGILIYLFVGIGAATARLR